MSDQICARAAQLIVKYDIHLGEKTPMVHCNETCVDPTNRDNVFSTFEEILKLGEDVAGIGYVRMYARSIQTQLPLDTVEAGLILTYNDSKNSADARLPLVSRPMVNSSGSAGNTMFLFQRCVLQGSAAPGSFLADDDGRLSLARLRNVAPTFADAIEGGVPTVVLSRDVRKEPRGLQDIQAAENARGGVQRLEHMVAIVRRICSLIADKSIFTRVGLTGVREMVRRQVPHFQEDIHGMTQWSLSMGGDTSWHVEWFVLQCEKSIPASRKLRGSMWEAVALTLPKHMLHVKGMLSFMALCCPKTQVHNGYCQWLSASDLKRFVGSTSWLAQAEVCENLLVEWHEKFKDGAKYVDIPAGVYQEVTGRMQNRMGRTLCKLQVDGLPEYDSPQAVARAAEDELDACCHV